MSTAAQPIQVAQATTAAPKAVALPTAPPWYVQFAINSGIIALHQALHNPSQAEYLHDVLLELRDAISATYPGE